VAVSTLAEQKLLTQKHAAGLTSGKYFILTQKGEKGQVGCARVSVGHAGGKKNMSYFCRGKRNG
jgi:hypothetical protein